MQRLKLFGEVVRAVCKTNEGFGKFLDRAMGMRIYNSDDFDEVLSFLGDGSKKLYRIIFKRLTRKEKETTYKTGDIIETDCGYRYRIVGSHYDRNNSMNKVWLISLDSFSVGDYAEVDNINCISRETIKEILGHGDFKLITEE